MTWDQNGQYVHTQFNADMISLPSHLLEAPSKSERAKDIIASYARKHVAMDVGLGLFNFFVPGTKVFTMVASLTAQIPTVFQPMIVDLAKVYSSVPTSYHDRIIVQHAVFEGIAHLLIHQVLLQAAGEIVGEVLQSNGLDFVLSHVPVFGIAAGLSLDATLAATITWRVGIVTSLYMQNDQQFPGGSPKTLYKEAKRLVGPLSSRITNRVNPLVGYQLPEIKERSLAHIHNCLNLLRAVSPQVSKEELRPILISQFSMPINLVDHALAAW